jgi:hypothetical protein
MAQYSVEIIHIGTWKSRQPYPGVTGKAIEMRSDNPVMIQIAQSFSGVQKVETIEPGVIHLKVDGDIDEFAEHLDDTLRMTINELRE